MEDCGSLNAPENGVVNVPVTTYQSVATYGCFIGYFLIGDNSRTCQAGGSWSGEEPFCQSNEKFEYLVAEIGHVCKQIIPGSIWLA